MRERVRDRQTDKQTQNERERENEKEQEMFSSELINSKFLNPFLAVDVTKLDNLIKFQPTDINVFRFWRNKLTRLTITNAATLA
jgi:hypothetical protein